MSCCCLQSRGLEKPPRLAIGDGALGFWEAVREVWPTTREQRCWVHKTANVLNAMPKHFHEKFKRMLHDIWMAENRVEAVKAFDLFIETFRAKYAKACECPAKDRDVLLKLHDDPAEH